MTWSILKTYIINIKNNIKDKKSHKNIGIYNIGYITIKKINNYENIHSVKPLYLMIDKVDGFIVEKMEVNI